MGDDTVSGTAERATPSPYAGVVWVPRYRATQIAAVLASILAIASAVALRGPLALGAVALCLAAYLAVSVAARRHRGVVTERVEADRRGLFLGRELVVPRGRIDAVQVERDDDGLWFVHIHVRRGGVVTIGVDDREDGSALARALQLDASLATAKFVTTRRAYSKVGLFAPLALPLLACSLWPLHAPPTLVAGALAGLFTLSAVVTASRLLRVKVGADGLVVNEGMKRARFIGHGEIRDVGRDGSTVVVTLRDGQTLRCAMGFAGGGAEEDTAEGMAEAMKRRIGEARGVHAAMSGDVSALPALVRGGRSTAEWMEALRRIGEDADGGPRLGPIGRERLWDVVEGSRAPADVRIAAAVALRAGELAGDGTRTRIAAIARACAEPGLEERMRVAADGQEAAMAEMLDRLAASP